MDLTPEDHADIAALTGEIMHLVDHCRTGRDGLKRDITGLLTRRIHAAQTAYETQLTAEETHQSGAGWFGHPISQCQPDICGRFPGQRRDPASEQT